MDEPKVIKEVKIPKAKKQNVDVKTIRDHKCHVGGAYYTFKKGIKQIVPLQVRQVLLKQNILAP